MTPKKYLGVSLEMKVFNRQNIWTMSSKDYVKLAITNVEGQLGQKGMKLPSKVTTPMNNTYSPKLDQSEELDNENITFYQEIIGML